MKQRFIYSLTVFGILFAATSASATPITVFGQDQNPSESTANSDSAYVSFMNRLSLGVRTEDFEDFAANESAPLSLRFPGSTGVITAILSGGGFVSDQVNGGAYATSGKQYYKTPSGETFSLHFSSPISTFGFWGTDISDLDATLPLTLTDTSGATTRLNVTDTTNLTNGNQLFFGFIDPSTSYTKIDFGNDGLIDGFGFDDMIIADSGQVTDSPGAAIPEPSELLVIGLGGVLLLIGISYRQRTRNT